MKTTTYIGIDYSIGRSNVNPLGFHYGVISQHSINPDALNDIEPQYGDAHCPECGEAVYESGLHPEADKDYHCSKCNASYWSDRCFPDEPIGMEYNKHGYLIRDCLDSDLFILDSPFYTTAQYCSPCVPGAGNLDNPCEDGPKTLCLGHDWFDGGKAPYPVYSVETREIVAQ